MVFSRFGLTHQDEPSQLDTLLRELPAVRPTAAEYIARTSYQTEYGIYDHERLHGHQPLAVVAMHPKEDVIEGGPLFTHIRRYHSHQIYKQFGVSLTEFLELPLHVVELLYAMAEAEATRVESGLRSAQRQMESDLDL